MAPKVKVTTNSGGVRSGNTSPSIAGAASSGGSGSLPFGTSSATTQPHVTGTSSSGDSGDTIFSLSPSVTSGIDPNLGTLGTAPSPGVSSSIGVRPAGVPAGPGLSGGTPSGSSGGAPNPGSPTGPATVNPVVPNSGTLSSDLFSIDSVERGVAVQLLLETNLELLTPVPEGGNPFNRDLLELFVATESTPRTISILKELEVVPLWDVANQILPTLVLLPLTLQFTVEGGVEIDESCGTPPYVWSDLGTRYPLMVCAIHRRPGSNIFLIYTGKIHHPIPLSPPFRGLLQSEVGTEFSVTRHLSYDLKVLVPSPRLLTVLLPEAIKKVPGIEVKVPSLNPLPSKSLYVHQDNIFLWSKHEAGSPSVKDELDSLFIVRNTTREIFATLQNSPFLVEVDPVKYVDRLVAMSLLRPTEVSKGFKYVNGLYHVLIRRLRIMEDSSVLSRFVLGDWPGTFQLHKLSLYYFLPVDHDGFDYVNETVDLFSALKNFFSFCTWMFGSHWLGQFDSNLVEWQSVHPWSSFSPWVLHSCFERALAAWFKQCRTHGSEFCYESTATALKYLNDEFDFHLRETNMEQVRDIYDRQLSKMIVYPKGTNAPPAIPGTRAAPKFLPSGSTKQVSEFITNTPSRTTSIDSNIKEEGARKRNREEGEIEKSSDPSPRLGSAGAANIPIRYCYANIASIYGITVNPKLNTKCDDPTGTSCKAGGKHFTSASRPSIDSITTTIRMFKNLSASTSDLVNKLDSLQH